MDRIIAYMPTRAVREVAAALGLEKEGYVALALHQYQYNGPDPEGVTSLYPNREAALRDFCWLARRMSELLKLEGAAPIVEVCGSYGL
ncbi:MAG: hypothetical protein QXP98_02380 [Thermoproteus sp.]